MVESRSLCRLKFDHIAGSQQQDHAMRRAAISIEARREFMRRLKIIGPGLLILTVVEAVGGFL